MHRRDQPLLYAVHLHRRYLLVTPPSVRSPKVREDKTPRALKLTPGASAEVLAILRDGTRRQAKTGRRQRHEWSVDPVVFVGLGEEDRLGLWTLLSCTAPTL